MVSEHRFIDEVLDDYRARLPGQAGDIYFELRQQTIRLVAYWEVFVDLYASGEEPIQVMSQCSEFAFHYIQQAMIRDIQLRVAKLTDPATSGWKPPQENASLRRLLTELEEAGAAAVLDQLTQKVVTIEAAAAPLRKIRNKLGAHTDLKMALGKIPRPQAPLVSEFDDLLEQLIGFMHVAEHHYLGSETVYRRSIATGAAGNLLFYLRSGLEHEAAKDRAP